MTYISKNKRTQYVTNTQDTNIQKYIDLTSTGARNIQSAIKHINTKNTTSRT